MHTLKATLRIEKATAIITLFYYDERRDLVAFNFIEGHSAASNAYYLNDTIAAHLHATPEDYEKAKAAYTKYFQDEINIVFNKRIKRDDNV